MKHCRVAFWVLCFVRATIPVQLFATDLSSLDKGRHVRLVMVGQGPLCDAKVASISPAVLTLQLSKAAPDCGGKDQLIYVSRENVLDLVSERRHLTKGRVASKLLLGFAGVAALATLPLTSSDPETWLILANPIMPGFVFYGAWKAVPKRLDYLLIMTCPDRRHCTSTGYPVPQTSR